VTRNRRDSSTDFHLAPAIWCVYTGYLGNSVCLLPVLKAIPTLRPFAGGNLQASTANLLEETS